MKVFLYFCFAWFSVTACARKMSNESPTPPGDVNSDVTVSIGTDTLPPRPVCIQKKIDSIKQQHIWNPPAEIHLYEYNGRNVWLISADCCDQFNSAVDENCNQVCAPSGGFTGRGDRKCIDFYDKAKHIALVWKDERAKKK